MGFKQAAFKKEVVGAGAKMEAVVFPLDSSPALDRFVCGGDSAELSAVVEVFHERSAAVDMDFGANREALLSGNQEDMGPI